MGVGYVDDPFRKFNRSLTFVSLYRVAPFSILPNLALLSIRLCNFAEFKHNKIVPKSLTLILMHVHTTVFSTGIFAEKDLRKYADEQDAAEYTSKPIAKKF